MSARPRRARRVAAALGLAGAVVAGAAATVATAPAASAHSVLVSSTPAAGATLGTPPADVTLTFDENVRAPAYVVVTGPDGTRVDQGSPRILDATVTQALRTSSPAGAYTVAYRVVSADGHPVEAQLTYTVTAGATASPKAAAPPAATAAAAPAPASAAGGGGDDGHVIHLVGGVAVVVLGAGALVFERLQRRRSPGAAAQR